MEELPKYINVTRVITFDVSQTEELIHAYSVRDEDEEVTLEEIMEHIEDEVSEYFTGSLKDLIWTDENGDELE
jgi:hypothetical protein